MKTIAKARNGGKTTEIIQRAANYNGYIVCIDSAEAHRVFGVAKGLKIDINFPITFAEFMTGRYYSPGMKTLHIDNADILLQRIARCPISTITVSTN